MFPKEMVILLSIALSITLDNASASQSSDITNTYINHLYNSLVGRGYLTEKDSQGYKFTYKGSEAFHVFLNNNRNKAHDIIKALHQLGIQSTYGNSDLSTEVTI